MPLQHRCSYCRELGHKKTTCQVRRAHLEAARAELGEQMAESSAKILEYKRQLQTEVISRKRDRIKWITIREKLRRARRARRRAEAELYKTNRKLQPLIVKAFPAILTLVTAGLTFMTKWYERIPYAQTIGLILLGLIPVLSLLFATLFLQKFLTLALGRSEAIEAGKKLKSTRSLRSHDTESEADHARQITNDINRK